MIKQQSRNIDSHMMTVSMYQNSIEKSIFVGLLLSTLRIFAMHECVADTCVLSSKTLGAVMQLCSNLNF